MLKGIGALFDGAAQRAIDGGIIMAKFVHSHSEALDMDDMLRGYPEQLPAQGHIEGRRDVNEDVESVYYIKGVILKGQSKPPIPLYKPGWGLVEVGTRICQLRRAEIIPDHIT